MSDLVVLWLLGFFSGWIWHIIYREWKGGFQY